MAQKPRAIAEHELKDRYREMLSDVYGSVDVCGMEYDAARVLEEIDPTAFRCGFLDWLDSEGSDYRLVEDGGEYYDGDEWAEYLEEVEAESEEEAEANAELVRYLSGEEETED